MSVITVFTSLLTKLLSFVQSKVWGNSIFVITADEQVKGYGTRLMNHLKQHARDVDGLTHFLTHAQQCCWLFYQAGWCNSYSLQ